MIAQATELGFAAYNTYMQMTHGINPLGMVAEWQGTVEQSLHDIPDSTRAAVEHFQENKRLGVGRVVGWMSAGIASNVDDAICMKYYWEAKPDGVLPATVGTIILGATIQLCLSAPAYFTRRAAQKRGDTSMDPKPGPSIKEAGLTEWAGSRLKRLANSVVTLGVPMNNSIDPLTEQELVTHSVTWGGTAPVASEMANKSIPNFNPFVYSPLAISYKYLTGVLDRRRARFEAQQRSTEVGDVSIEQLGAVVGL